jgi:undecaprenyl phosphate N,N'-diacetylbacillosamine 1-phosphate transferase
VYRRYGKRVFDLTLTIPLIIVLSPLLALVAVLVRLSSPGPALFVQERLGLRGRIFHALKFRTMTNRKRSTHREIVGRDPEVTRIGHWLRRFKIDELPQLLNVLRGDMSIVGPRPALPAQLPDYDEFGRKRLTVRPGLTGLAQVNGNIHLTWPERWRYDAGYVDRMSLRLDLWIIYRTFVVLMLGEDRFVKQPSMPGEEKS